MSQNDVDINFAYALLSAKAGRMEEAEYYLEKAKEAGTVSARRMVLYETAVNPKRFRKSNRTDRLEAMGFDLTPIAKPTKPKRISKTEIIKQGRNIKREWKKHYKMMNPSFAEKYLKKHDEWKAQLSEFKYIEAWWRSSRDESVCVCKGTAKMRNGLRRILAKAANQKFGKFLVTWDFAKTDDIYLHKAVCKHKAEWIELRGVKWGKRRGRGRPRKVQETAKGE